MDNDTLSLAMALLERASITPEDNGCQLLLADRLKQIGFEITHFPINQVNNLWAKRGKEKPFLCFVGHTDVVPPGDLSAWDSPPFTPTIRDGKLYARGAADMKSSIAAMVVACERFIKKYPHYQGSIAFLITSDEEGPAIDGTQAVLKMLNSQGDIPDWCLVGEASSTDKLGDTIKVGRRGSLTGYLKIVGRQGHVAYPDLAKNAIHLALKPIQAILDLTWDQGEDPFPPTTLQFANIQAGTGATNVIPGSIEANFNLRFSPKSTPEYIQQTIENTLNQLGYDYTLRWQLGAKPFYTAPGLLRQVIASVVTEEMGYSPIHATSGGTSDGRFFAEYGCQVVELGPINATIHQINECIDIAELTQLSILYEKILMSLFSL